MVRWLWPTEVAEACALSTRIAGRVDTRALYVCLAWMRYVITLRYARGRDWGAAGAVALWLTLRRSPALGDPLGLLRGVAQLDVLAHPAVLQIHLRIRVAIQVLRRTLTPTPRTHRAAFPARFRQGGVSLF